jgi:hypothetical protein
MKFFGKVYSPLLAHASTNRFQHFRHLLFFTNGYADKRDSQFLLEKFILVTMRLRGHTRLVFPGSFAAAVIALVWISHAGAAPPGVTITFEDIAARAGIEFVPPKTR